MTIKVISDCNDLRQVGSCSSSSSHSDADSSSRKIDSVVAVAVAVADDDKDYPILWKGLKELTEKCWKV